MSGTEERQGASHLFHEAMSLTSSIEALVFAAPSPLKPAQILDILQDPSLSVRQISDTISDLRRFYKERGGGFNLVETPDGFRFETTSAASNLMERLFSQSPRPLSRAAQETLAIVAYRQPVTRADIEFIRGVDAGSIIKNLLERGLIHCTGRKEDAGRPMLFETTTTFLQVFSLTSLEDLPPLSAFQPSSEMVAHANEQIQSHQANHDLSSALAIPETSNPL
jgi:segregation and condensation protein B